MKLLSSGDTLSFLSRGAPRPWVKRMLSWMIFQGELDPYFTNGKITPFVAAFTILHEAPELIGVPIGLERDALIKKHFDGETAEQLLKIGPTDKFFDEPTVWDESSEPHLLSPGFIVFAQDVDWEAGTISCEIDRYMAGIEYLFDSEDDHLATQFDKADFDVQLEGMCFNSDVIEMLSPQSGVIEIARTSRIAPTRLRGRPPKWDWEEAIAHVVGLAQHPDGLPTGPGAQTLIEKAIAEWFIEEVGDTPAESQIRLRAQAIMRKIRKDGKS